MAAKTKGGVYKKTQKLFPFRIDYWPDNSKLPIKTPERRHSGAFLRKYLTAFSR